MKIKSAAAHLLRVAIERQLQDQPTLKVEISNSLLNKIYKETAIQVPSTVPGQPDTTVVIGPSGFALFGYLVTLTQFGFDITKPVILD